MNKCIFILLHLSILLLLSSCKDIINSDNNKKITRFSTILNDQSFEVLIPLKLDNYWIYNVTHYDTSGNVLKLSLDTMKVISTINIGNDRFFRLSRTFPVYSDILLLVNTDLGLWSYCMGDCDLNDYLMAKYPVKIGDIFRSEHSIDISGYDMIGYRVNSTRNLKYESNEKVNSEAGIFDCFKFIEFYNNFNPNYLHEFFHNGNITRYYALNVGKIKEEIYKAYYNNDTIINEKLIWKWELKEFKLY